MSEVNKSMPDETLEDGSRLLQWIRAVPDKKDLEAMVMTLTVISNSSAGLDTAPKDFAAASNWAALLHENLTILRLLYNGYVCAKANDDGLITITESPAGAEIREQEQNAAKTETTPEQSDN
jgi:hypothetical protein